MKSRATNNLLIIFILLLLCITAFVSRFEHFLNSDEITIDEMVYARMGLQMTKDPFDYNTLPYGQDLSAMGRQLPQYFFEPLFKHPPLFSAMIAASFRIKGTEFKNSFYPSLLAGTLSIIVIYFLGAVLYSKTTGLFAAILLWMDPISIICSQKIWMDPVITFFTLLAMTCFARAVKNKRPWFFIWAGLATGCAINTKYTGALPIFIFLAYSLIYERDLFKIRRFRIGMLLPLLMLIPWILWNTALYGTHNLLQTLQKHSELQTIFNIILQNMFLFAFLLGLFLLAQILFKLMPRQKRDRSQRTPLSERTFSKIERLSVLFVIILLAAGFKEYILRSLNFWNIPVGTWYQGVFSQEPPKFYIGRLIEFSALYTFGIVSLLTFHRNAPKEHAIVRLSAGVILIFFILWRNYQSRYILSVVPFVILLSADLLIKILRWIETQPFGLRLIEKPAFILFIIYALTKTATIDILFAFPNDMCYF